MSYCVGCGTEIEDGKQLCKSCEDEKKNVSEQSPTQGKKASEKKPEQSFEFYIDLYKNLLLKPDKPLKDAIHAKNVIPSAITVGLATLYFSLISLYFMRYFFYFLGVFSSGFGGLGYSYSYGAIFFKSFFLFAIQWPLFALSLFLIMKLFKYEISFIQSLNITGIANFYLLVVGIAATILGFISPSIGIVVFLGGFFTTAFAVYVGIQPLLKNKNPLEVYLMPAVILAFLFVQGIFMQIM